jgi:hypothetical protein
VAVAIEPGAAPSRRSVPVTAVVALALAVWGAAAWHAARERRQASNAAAVAEDPVASELRRFRRLSDRGEWLRDVKRLGPIRDPRVTVALMDVVRAEAAEQQAGRPCDEGKLMWASFAVCEYHIPEAERMYGTKYWAGALIWWEKHEAEFRQRAASLPQ